MIISLDTETTGLDFFHGARAYYVTTCDDQGVHRNWGHNWSVDLYTREVRTDPKEVQEIEQLLNDADQIVMHNGGFDVRALWFLGVRHFPWHKLDDTLIAGHILASNQKHNLTDTVMLYLGVDIEPFEKAVEKYTGAARRLCRTKAFIEDYGHVAIAHEDRPDMPSAGGQCWKADMWLLKELSKLLNYPDDHEWQTALEEYANPDSSATLALWMGAGSYQGMEAHMKERGDWEMYRQNLETVRITWGMKQTGLTRSVARSKKMRNEFSREEHRLTDKCLEVASAAGFDLTVPKGSGVNNSLRAFVFDHLRLPVRNRTKKGAASLDADTLLDWSLTVEDDHAREFVTTLLRKRSYGSALNALEAYDRYALPLDWVNGYEVVHPDLNPVGTGTTRLSSSNPNGQNVSVGKDLDDDEKLPSVRWVFGPAPGREWWCLDYDNIEMRIPAYFSGERKMIDLFEKPDEPPYFGSYHLLNASIVFPDQFWPLVDKKGEFKRLHLAIYKKTKNFGFALQYDCGERTADNTAGVVGAFKAVTSELRDLAAAKYRELSFARKWGFVTTIPDASVNPNRGYPLLVGRTFDGTMRPTTPWNYKIQGTAGWAKKRAMIRCDEQLREWKRTEKFSGKMILDVHDELIFDFPMGRKGNRMKIERIRELMEMSGKDISIPLKVSIGYHPNNWADEEDFSNVP